jgi:hypothetical protein
MIAGICQVQKELEVGSKARYLNFQAKFTSSCTSHLALPTPEVQRPGSASVAAAAANNHHENSCS